MDVLIIDLGTYAIKFLQIFVDRKQVSILNHHLVFIERVRPQLKPDLTNIEVQHEIVRSYLKNNPFEGKIIFQIPVDLTTSRFITLPVGNKRKAEMMIPFQLDDNLPFPSTSIHYTSTWSKTNPTESQSLISITQLDFFQPYYETLQENGILPAILTSELGFVHSFADAAEISGPAAFIDLGHSLSKCYFIFNKQVVSTHLSFIAGKSVNEMLAITYQLSGEDAEIYKHENAYFLTSNQYETVSSEQAHFAKLMAQVFQPLVQDIKRWEVGFRVKYGHPVEKIYLMGGTSQIKNFAGYLTEQIGIQVELYNPYPLCVSSTEPVSKNNQSFFALAAMAAFAHRGRVPISNFLHGVFKSNYSTNIPIHSTTFLFTRTLVISLFLCAILFAERSFFLDKQTTLISQRAREANLSGTERTQFNRNPARMLTQLKTKSREISQEVQLIQSASTTDAMAVLSQLSSSLGANNALDMIFFRSIDQSVEARFASENLEDLRTLQGHLDRMGLNEVILDLDDANKELFLSFKGQL
jgi:general secretion pathway protein L